MNRVDESPTVLVLGKGDWLAQALGNAFRVITAVCSDQALLIARERRVHVLVVAQPEQHAESIDTLRRVREVSPCTLGILLAGQSERSACLAAAREGEIFRVAQDAEQLREFVALAADQSLAFFAVHGPATGRDNRSCVLVLDEDTATAERVREVLRLEPGAPPAVHWCDTLYEAFDALANRSVGLLVADVRLDGEDISAGLRTLRRCHPDVATLLFTSVKDTRALSGLIGNGCVLVPKPASRERLAGALAAARSPLASVALSGADPIAARPGRGRLRALMGKLGRWPEAAIRD